MTTASRNLRAETYLNLLRLHEKLSGEFTALFREHDLTPAQYNVLRILRGAPGHEGSCQYVGDRLVNREPDVTRLIDRAQKAGLVTRVRSTEDRRVVLIRLTAKGRKLCDRLDAPVKRLHDKQFRRLSPSALRSLNDRLLEALAP